MATPVSQDLSHAAAQVAQALREEVFARLAPDASPGQPRDRDVPAPGDAGDALESVVLEVGHVLVCCGLGQPADEVASRQRLAQACRHPRARVVVQAVAGACLSSFFPALLDDPGGLAAANARLRSWLGPA